jgi:hypothetical protein
MSLPSMNLLLDALREPRSMAALTPGEWDLLIRQARPADLLARLGALAQQAGVWDGLLSAPRAHLASAQRLAQRQHAELRHEVNHVAQALSALGLPVVVLKGAAYVLQDSQAALGRMVSDVDILVPRERMADVESALMMAGWVSTNRDAYDQRYYRQWMHEIPPLRHMGRGTVLDVHHTILPLTARFKPDAALLMAAAEPVRADGSVRALSRADQVLHSAAHLFHEGELEMGLRGLIDLDALLQESGVIDGFWESLMARAAVLDLRWPLYQALRYTRQLLGTPVPEQIWRRVVADAAHRPSGWRLRWQDALYARALRPVHPSLSDAWTPAARFLLYLRGHWLRMPPGLLAWHLLRKSLTGWRTPATDP